MKTIKHVILTILLCLSYNAAVMSQHLDSIPVAKRDSILIGIAKEVVLKIGPDYYRDEFKPIIERYVTPPKGEKNPTGEHVGRVFYHVTFPYNPEEETLSMNYAAKVSIWADTREPAWVMFGNGAGIHISEDQNWRTDPSIDNIMSYQESVRPIYEIDNPKPKNYDELIRKGYVEVEGSNGQWVRTRPDTPPAKALKVIEQAKEDLKRREMGNQ